MSNSVKLLLALLSVVLQVDSTFAQKPGSNVSANFDNFKVEVASHLHTHIAWSSNPSAKLFKTIITEGVKEGVNFAGHYRIVEWGCGSPCQNWVIVDLLSGRIYDGISTVRGTQYHSDSRLIVLNPLFAKDNSDLMPEVFPEYYEWKNNRLHLIKNHAK